MKSISKLFLLLPLALGISLSGCKNSGVKHVESEPPIVEPVEVELVSIAVSGEFKTEYTVGEEFDATGIIVTASYSDESTEVVTEETTFNGFSSEFAGPVVVTASYEDKTAEINLTVNSLYTPYGVVCDLVLTSFDMEVTEDNCALLAQYGWIEENEDGSWWGGCAVYFNYNDESYLAPVLDYYLSSAYIPSYISQIEEAEVVDYSGTSVGIAYAATDDFGVIIEALDYINSSGEMHIEFTVYSAAE